MTKYIIDAGKRKAQISRFIYGHFSEHLGRCIYEGIYVGENGEIPNINGMRKDVIDALYEMKIPMLRWPGGCFADEYHWQDGIGNNRKKMINTNWGGIVEDNSFGTHEFLELCKLLDCEPYIAGNVGSGSVRELSNWIEYMNFDGLSPMSELRRKNGKKEPFLVKYIGVGNENWGCGGNMRALYYSDLYKNYSTYLKDYKDAKLYKIACGPNSDDYDWTETLMKYAKDKMNGLALHYYTLPYSDGFSNMKKGSSIDFDTDEYYMTIKNTCFMEELIKQHVSIMDRYDKEGKVDLVIDEWGAWYDVLEGTNPNFLYQQNTMRDAIIAAINLNVFNKNSNRVKIANIAQVVNVLQSVILTEGTKMVKTPTYYVFKMFATHQDADNIESYITTNEIGTEGNLVKDIYESASIDDSGNMTITLCNIDLDNEKEISCDILSFNIGNINGEVLEGKMDEFNDFENENVITKEFNQFSLTNEGFIAKIPPCSVVKLYLEK